VKHPSPLVLCQLAILFIFCSILGCCCYGVWTPRDGEDVGRGLGEINFSVSHFFEYIYIYLM